MLVDELNIPMTPEEYLQERNRLHVRKKDYSNSQNDEFFFQGAMQCTSIDLIEH